MGEVRTIEVRGPAEEPAKYYFECHVTVEPVAGDELMALQQLAKDHNFFATELAMKYRNGDVADFIMTSHSKLFTEMLERETRFVNALRLHGFTVTRYKIENTVQDSRFEDSLGFFN